MKLKKAEVLALADEYQAYAAATRAAVKNSAAYAANREVLAQKQSTIAKALCEYADRMEAEPSADEVERVARAMYIADKNGKIEWPFPTNLGDFYFGKLARAAIAAMREAPAQADAPTSVPADEADVMPYEPPESFTATAFGVSAPQRGERTAALSDDRLKFIASERCRTYDWPAIAADLKSSDKVANRDPSAFRFIANASNFVGELLSEVAILKADNARLDALWAESIEENIKLTDKNADLKAERDAALAENARLRARLEAVEKVADWHAKLAEENLRYLVLQASRDYGEIRMEVVREVRAALKEQP